MQATGYVSSHLTAYTAVSYHRPVCPATLNRGGLALSPDASRADTPQVPDRLKVPIMNTSATLLPAAPWSYELNRWRKLISNVKILRAMYERRRMSDQQRAVPESEALWDGWYALHEKAEELEKQVIYHGGLLCLVQPWSTPSAPKRAR